MIYDTASSILQFYGYPTFAASLSNVPGAVLTNHHGVLYTLLMGGAIRLGDLIGSQNTGFFIYILLQTLFASAVAAYGITVLAPHVHKAVWILAAAACGLHPLISIWTITMSKDSLFAIVGTLLGIMLFQVVESRGEILRRRRFLAQLVAVNVLMTFAKNVGAYILLFCAVFLLLYYRRQWIGFLISFVLPAVLYLTVVSGLVLPAFGVAPSGRQEMFGFMFQQTARYVKEYPQDVTEEEKEAIRAILPYDELRELYNPVSQDSVKFRFHQQASSEDMKRYMKTWFSMFLKHPRPYWDATMDITGRYFAPAKEEDLDYMPRLAGEVRLLKENEAFDIHYSGAEEQRHSMTTTFRDMSGMPVIGLLFQRCFYVWAVMLCVVVAAVLPHKERLLFLLPYIVQILFLFIAPVASTRYMLLLIWSFPFMIGSMMAK
ncbi:MAG: hypothetical protein IJ100_07245 [Lachnospiraceae bacterium]|nr:hypothetical protein [Lachnospiraceae bacterium]